MKQKGGRVKGVKAVMADGTPVTAHARKGVIIATGGYAANISKVIDSNRRRSHWDRFLGMTAAMTQVPVPTAKEENS